MAEISAKAVKDLRDKTGAGMMDCKNALKDAEGAVDRALELLRERGLAKAGTRAGRATSEGAIGVAADGSAAGIIELGCETDFVAKTDAFQALAAEIAGVVAADPGLTSAEKALDAKLGSGSVRERIQETVGRVGENIELKRVQGLQAGSGVAGVYLHAGARLGVLVAIETSASGDAIEKLAKDVSMHVAAADPTPIAVDRDGVPVDTVENERRILTNQALQSGKPEKVIEKIVNGRIGKFFAENCLLEQPFVKDPDSSVGDVIKKAASEAGADAAVSGFIRFKLGEASQE